MVSRQAWHVPHNFDALQCHRRAERRRFTGRSGLVTRYDRSQGVSGTVSLQPEYWSLQIISICVQVVHTVRCVWQLILFSFYHLHCIYSNSSIDQIIQWVLGGHPVLRYNCSLCLWLVLSSWVTRSEQELLLPKWQKQTKIHTISSHCIYSTHTHSLLSFLHVINPAAFSLPDQIKTIRTWAHETDMHQHLWASFTKGFDSFSAVWWDFIFYSSTLILFV